MMGVEGDIWKFSEKTEKSGYATISDEERGFITVRYNLDLGSAVLTVTKDHNNQKIKQTIKFKNEGGEKPSVNIKYQEVTRGYPLLPEYVQKSVGPMVSSFIEELKLLGLEGLIDYEQVKDL